MMDIEYVKQCVIVNSASAVRDEILDIIERLLTAEKERDQYKAELIECTRVIEQLQVAEHQKHLELESLRAKIKEAQEQEPVAYGIPNSSITGRKQPMMTLHHERCGQYPKLMVPLYAAPVIPD